MITGGGCALGTVCTEGSKWLEEIGVNMRIDTYKRLHPLWLHVYSEEYTKPDENLPPQFTWLLLWFNLH